VVCDALDGSAVARAVSAARADALIHELTELPASLQPRAFGRQLAATNRLRREGTRNLVAAAQTAGVRRVMAQSVAFAYAPTGDWVKDESAPLALDAEPPMDKMVAAVHELERQVLEAGGIALRYGFFYGPGTHFAEDGFYAKMVRLRLFPTVGSGEGRWSFIHVDDAAAATVAALERGNPGVYNIVDDEPAPVREWLPVYAEANGGRRPLHVPAWLGRLVSGSVGMAAMTTQRAASNAKAKRELGWQPVYASWRDGFHAAAA
jgi:nucleoside-diphosphate-sugar epimerase